MGHSFSTGRKKVMKQWTATKISITIHWGHSTSTSWNIFLTFLCRVTRLQNWFEKIYWFYVTDRSGLRALIRGRECRRLSKWWQSAGEHLYGILSRASSMLSPSELFDESWERWQERRKIQAKLLNLVSCWRLEDLRAIGMQTPIIHMNLPVSNLAIKFDWNI